MDEPTVEGIVREHLRFIQRTLSSLGVRVDDLDDVVQEVLHAVHRGLPAFDPSRAMRPEGAVRAWLSGICERQAANHRRRQHRRAEELRDNEELDSLGGASKSAEECLLARERDAVLASVLSRIEPGLRAVIVAHELLGTPMVEIARAQGIPVNTGWNRLRLARAAVRAALDPARDRRTDNRCTRPQAATGAPPGRRVSPAPGARPPRRRRGRR